MCAMTHSWQGFGFPVPSLWWAIAAIATMALGIRTHMSQIPSHRWVAGISHDEALYGCERNVRLCTRMNAWPLGSPSHASCIGAPFKLIWMMQDLALTWMSHDTHMNESWCKMACTWMSGAHMYESCHTYEWVMTYPRHSAMAGNLTHVGSDS